MVSSILKHLQVIFKLQVIFQLYCLEIHDKIKVCNYLVLIHFFPQNISNLCLDESSDLEPMNNEAGLYT